MKLYRQLTGTAWFGPVEVQRVDAPKGKDVAGRVHGDFPVLFLDRLHVFRYRDDLTPWTPRTFNARVQLVLPNTASYDEIMRSK